MDDPLKSKEVKNPTIDINYDFTENYSNLSKINRNYLLIKALDRFQFLYNNIFGYN